MYLEVAGYVQTLILSKYPGVDLSAILSWVDDHRQELYPMLQFGDNWVIWAAWQEHVARARASCPPSPSPESSAPSERAAPKRSRTGRSPVLADDAAAARAAGSAPAQPTPDVVEELVAPPAGSGGGQPAAEQIRALESLPAVAAPLAAEPTAEQRGEDAPLARSPSRLARPGRDSSLCP